MNFDLGGFFNFSVGPGVKYGLAAVGLGFLLLILFAKKMAGPQILEVPDGTPADKFYREWKKSALSRRVGRAWLFVTFLGVGLLLGGCGATIAGVLS
jgi:hypothetical protein